MNRTIHWLLIVCAVLIFARSAHATVTIAWTEIANPGNPSNPATDNETNFGGPFGSVPYSFEIGTYDVTNKQYVAFLNAKDPTGANKLGLFDNTGYGYSTYGGIGFNPAGPSGSKYSVLGNFGNRPVNYVNWLDAVRFANWLNNGQGDGDTETGSYTLLGG
ncbi:MAG: SUMF1/EgtB/PvdO family nonheme iron enzyme, partial [Singulisphaera sp.]